VFIDKMPASPMDISGTEMLEPDGHKARGFSQPTPDIIKIMDFHAIGNHNLVRKRNQQLLKVFQLFSVKSAHNAAEKNRQPVFSQCVAQLQFFALVHGRT
jgi:hypothetical protein